jgi:hypothetical protein
MNDNTIKLKSDFESEGHYNVIVWVSNSDNVINVLRNGVNANWGVYDDSHIWIDYHSSSPVEYIIYTSEILQIPVTANIVSCTSSGTEKNEFTTEETIYVKGINFPANTTMDIYIVNNTEWLDGMPIGSYRNHTTAITDENGEFFALVWSNPIEGGYDIVADANRDGYYNASLDAVDDVSATPGVTAVITSTQVLINNLEFGNVKPNESAYYYPTPSGTASISEGNASGIIPFAVIQGNATIEISLGTNKTFMFPKTGNEEELQQMLF